MCPSRKKMVYAGLMSFLALFFVAVVTSSTLLLRILFAGVMAMTLTLVVGYLAIAMTTRSK